MSALSSFLNFAGGLGMFIYGMNVMAEGMQKAAGEKTRQLMSILTSNRLMGVLVGAAVTAIIQSSSAATVLVVGFVNAQLMNLQQAAGVIMGANIGTTMTAWLVSLSEWGSFLKPEKIAPLLLLCGVFLAMMVKKERTRQTAGILTGFGLLFIGLSMMAGAVKPYADAPIFQDLFLWIGASPVLGILTGALVTAVIQSSSASMGILQTLAAAGLVNWGSAAFIVLGQNIGTCVNALISGIGADTNAKRAGMIHLEFNVIGSLMGTAVLLIFFALYPSARMAGINSTSLAVFHSAFNILTTIILFPFAGQLVKLSKFFVRDHHQEEYPRLVRLDQRLLRQPQIALEAVWNEIQAMGQLALQNITYSRDVLIDRNHFEQLQENEEQADIFHKEITAYLEKLDAAGLNAKDQLRVKHCMLVLRDLEHISDRCQEIGWIAQESLDQKPFGETTIEDINTISAQCYKAVHAALQLMEKRDLSLVDKIYAYEDKVDVLQEQLHNSRIQSIEASGNSVSENMRLLEIIDCYERIADHARRLAGLMAAEEAGDVIV